MFGFLSIDACVYSQTFQDLTARPVISWHQPQLDRDAGFYHQMPQNMHWHCYSKFLRGKINRIYQKFLQHLTQKMFLPHIPSPRKKYPLTNISMLHLPSTELGISVGNQATLLKAEVCRELIRASSDTPPVQDRGPMWSTLHKISSLYMALGSWNVLVAALRSCFLQNEVSLLELFPSKDTSLVTPNFSHLEQLAASVPFRVPYYTNFQFFIFYPTLQWSSLT